MSEVNCPFCDPQVLEQQTIYEFEKWLVITNINPIMPSHVMLIPKRHIRRLEQCNEEEWKEFPLAWTKASFHVKANSDWPMMYMNAPQDQSVGHLHIHFIPGKFKMHGIDRALRDILKKELHHN